MKIDISFVILTWNSEEVIIQSLRSVIGKCEEEHLQYEIIVADNGSNDGTLKVIEEVCKSYESIKLIRLHKNTGTTYPRNLALKMSKGDYVCILDSDTVFLDGRIKDILSKLDDEVGLVVPKLILPSGEVQNSVKKFPSAFSKLLKIPKIIFRLNIKDYDFYPQFPFAEDAFVDTAISATWFFHRDLLEKVGYLDENIFYSPEDIDYCLRVRRFGMKILYYCDFTVLHYTQQITHRKFFSKTSISHLKGLIYYYIKHRYLISPKV